MHSSFFRCSRRWPRALAAASLGLTGFVGSVAAESPAHAASPQTATLSPSSAVLERINAIRTSDHLSAGIATTAYGAQVRQGLRLNQDPPFVRTVGGIVGEESLWGEVPATSSITPSPTFVVNAWVFQDGWRGSLALTWNVDCVSPAAPACNGHRRAVLSRPPVAGARLYIDVATRSIDIGGVPSVAVATLMVWKLP